MSRSVDRWAPSCERTARGYQDRDRRQANGWRTGFLAPSQGIWRGRAGCKWNSQGTRLTPSLSVSPLRSSVMYRIELRMHRSRNIWHGVVLWHYPSSWPGCQVYLIIGISKSSGLHCLVLSSSPSLHRRGYPRSFPSRDSCLLAQTSPSLLPRCPNCSL